MQLRKTWCPRCDGALVRRTHTENMGRHVEARYACPKCDYESAVLLKWNGLVGKTRAEREQLPDPNYLGQIWVVRHPGRTSSR